jgi:hypothetical protein
MGWIGWLGRSKINVRVAQNVMAIRIFSDRSFLEYLMQNDNMFV